jgi:3D (Asp-Asp-Asp) domain-containing protein
VRVRTASIGRLVGFAVVLLIAAEASARPPHRHPRRPPRNATFRMTATAYCDHGKTKSGAHARNGIVAADPRKLPLGTRIQIIAPGRPYAGTYTVMDTGSGIKGRDLDIFMASCGRAKTFGRRVVRARVLSRDVARETPARAK